MEKVLLENNKKIILKTQLKKDIMDKKNKESMKKNLKIYKKRENRMLFVYMENRSKL